MSRERVTQAIKDLEDALNADAHNCDVHIEELDDAKEVSFYLDASSTEDVEPIGILAIFPKGLSS